MADLNFIRWHLKRFFGSPVFILLIPTLLLGITLYCVDVSSDIQVAMILLDDPTPGERKFYVSWNNIS